MISIYNIYIIQYLLYVIYHNHLIFALFRQPAAFPTVPTGFFFLLLNDQSRDVLMIRTTIICFLETAAPNASLTYSEVLVSRHLDEDAYALAMRSRRAYQTRVRSQVYTLVGIIPIYLYIIIYFSAVSALSYNI